MSSINLNLENKNSGSGNKRLISSGLWFSIAILFLILCAYGTIIFFDKKTQNEMKYAEEQYKNEYQKFIEGNGGALVDLSNRKTAAKQLLESDFSMGEMLEKVERDILPQVYLESFSFDQKSRMIKLSCVADNFNTIAKQILSFKQSGNFSQVFSKEALFDSSKGALTFNVELFPNKVK